MKSTWIVNAIFALLIFSVMSFFITVLTRKGHSVTTVLLGVGFFFTIFLALPELLSSTRPAFPSLKLIAALAGLGLLSALGNYFQFNAANDAPNPGLAIAIVGQQAILITTLAVIFLKDKLNSLQIAGIVLGAIAIGLINFGSSKNKAAEPVVSPTSLQQK